MLRTLALVGLGLIAAGCAASEEGADRGEAAAYLTVTNDDILTYTIYADGVRIGRVASSTTRRIPLQGAAFDGSVEFSARSTSGETRTWGPVMVQAGVNIELRIPYEAR